jgi:predicted cobalt transporter CbtA
MVRTFLIRGLLAGAFAGLIGFGVAFVVGEPHVGAAIAVEQAGASGHSHADDAAPGDAAPGDAAAAEGLVSRDLQSTLGLVTATLGYGLAMGGLFGLLCAAAYGRMGQLSPRASSALLAGAAFTSVVLVPFLKYPANPPAVGNPDTIDERTYLYLTFVAVSVLLAWVSVVAGRALAPRFGAWNASLMGGAGYLVAVFVSGSVLPEVDEVPDGFPASLLYDFRVSSLATQFAIWTALGLAVGYLAERGSRPASQAEPEAVGNPG